MAFFAGTNTLLVITVVLVIFGANYVQGQGGVLIGQPCENDPECVGYPNSRCTGICNCIPTHISSNRLDKCLPIEKDLASPCEESQQCQGETEEEARVCEAGRCRCGADFVSPAEENKCYRKAVKVDDDCERDVQCHANLEYASCFREKCVCFPDTVASENATKCLQERNLGGICVEQGQCEHISNSVCIPATGENVGHSECQCSTDNDMFVPNPNRPQLECMRVAELLGESCSVHNDQCKGLNDSFCNATTHTCQCREEDQISNQDNNACLRKLPLNATCTVNRECHVENSECRTGKCLCKDEFVEGVTGCLPMGKDFGAECVEHVQCAGIAYREDLVCYGGFCNCANREMEYYNGECALRKRLYHTCSTHAECHLGSNNYTACALKPNSKPPVKWCMCAGDMMEMYDTCWPQKKVGDYCSVALDCAMTITGPVLCDEGTKKCTCATDYVPHSSNLHCVSAANTIKYALSGTILALVTIVISIF